MRSGLTFERWPTEAITGVRGARLPPLFSMRHTTLPLEREAPSALLSELREIDPSLELVHVERDRWMVGSFRPNELRRRVAGAMLERLRHKKGATIAEYRMARLIMEGFSPIASYTLRDPDGRIVSDVREREWNLRHRAEAVFQKKLEESEGKPEADQKLSTLRDQAEVGSRDRAIWRQSHTVS